MSAEIGRENKPSLEKLSRRRLIKLLAWGGGALAATAVGSLNYIRKSGPRSASRGHVPVRNPAYQAAESDLDGHVVVYCQTGTGEFLAYDLNSAGALIWESCLEHSSFQKGDRKCVEQIAAQVAGRVDAPDAVSFIELMVEKGLLYLGLEENEAYFVRVEAI